MAVLALVAAAPARADSGSITNAVPIYGTGEVRVMLTVSHDWCTPSDIPHWAPDCSWRGLAFLVDVQRSCPEHPDMVHGRRELWTGEFHSTPGVETVTRQFGSPGDPWRVCLYVDYAGGTDLLAQAVDTPPVPTLTLADAKLHARDELSRRARSGTGPVTRTASAAAGGCRGYECGAWPRGSPGT